MSETSESRDTSKAETGSAVPTAREGAGRMLQGAGLVVLLLWSLISWAPAIDLLYGTNATPDWLNWLFLVGSAPALGAVWCVAYWALTRDGRAALRAALRRRAGLICVYAALWMVAYQWVA
jgi:hypothetical protein